MKKTMALAYAGAFLFCAARATAATASRGAMTATMSTPSRGGEYDVGDSLASPEVGVGGPVTELNLSRIGAGHQRPGDPGLVVGARYFYQTTPRLSLGAEISHTNFGDRDFVVPGLAGTIGGSVLTAQALARYWLMEPQMINPYAIGGIGLNHFAAQVHETFAPSDVLLDADSVGLALTAGAGVEGRFGEEKSFLAGTELRWLLSTVDSSAFGSSLLSSMGLGGWVGYKF